jgi:class 3 adenylate cyclase
MFIDRHDAAGVTPEELAAAHELDLAIQEQYRVQYHTYWFDPDNGAVFCLAEGPSREAVEEVHRVAHGMPASLIIEIDRFAPLNAFFGTLPNHPPGTPYSAPAVRAIVFTDMCGSVAQTHQLGDDGHLQLLREHNAIVRTELSTHNGREVKHTGDGIMAAFTSVAAAVAFAVDVQRALARRNGDGATPLEVSIGISAGEPVTDSDDDLFGAAVQLAARLCSAASPGEIHVSVAVRELCMGKPIRFEDLGTAVLKGLPEPAQIYSVAWREERRND